MDNYGVVLRKLRYLNKLPLKAAAIRIGRSAGWLSEIENGKGAARIHSQEFDRIVAVYGGENYRKQFGIWVANAHKPVMRSGEAPSGGPVLKYLRVKAGQSLRAAAREAGISPCYLSYLETGVKPLSQELRDRLMRLYGYSPASYKNFTTEDKRAKNISARYKFDVVLKRMDEGKIEKLLAFALSLDDLGAT